MDTLKNRENFEISNPFLERKEIEYKKKSQAKNENFIVGRPKMVLSLKLYFDMTLWKI